MPVACDLFQPFPGLFFWQYYDPKIKAELCSSAILASEKIYLVDPILLEASQLDRLRRKAPPAGIIVTNANHVRASEYYSKELSVPILAQPATFQDEKRPEFVEIAGDKKICPELEVIVIEGAVAGEIALYDPLKGGTLIIGDALINFDPPGFAVLPKKYCIDEKRLRQSLWERLTRSAERMLFAHGAPILSGANAHLRRLLTSDS
jgi:hypothetical protein